MRLNVRTLTNRIIVLEVKETDIIKQVKQYIEDKEGVPCIQQMLFFTGKMLDDDKHLSFYNIKENAVICLVLKLCGR